MLAKSLLPRLNLSQQNVQYYASLVDYYDVYDLRKELKSEQTYLYLLCYLSQRYLHLNDNLMDAFCMIWFKELFGADKTINRYPVTASPEKTRPKRLEKYLFDTNAKGEKKFHAVRYEVWIYRQLKKRLKAGELYLADSIHNRSLQQELSLANEKGALVKPLDIPALRRPIKQLLDERCAELRSEWLKFNTDFTQGKLKHLFYDEKTKTLHLKKSNTDQDEEAQYRFYEQLPLCDITDVLRFVC